jgi:tRNA G18 (ribose-2'-O)-methylase SpoU
MMRNSISLAPGAALLCGMAGGISTAFVILTILSSSSSSKSKKSLPKTEHASEKFELIDDRCLIDANNDADSAALEDRVLRKAETVLLRRTARIVVVVERCCNDHNYSAILRTAEALGVQHVYLIQPPVLRETTSSKKKKVWEEDQAQKKEHNSNAQNATKWITLHIFDTTAECLDALKADDRTLWVTDLSQEAECLTVDDKFGARLEVPERVAIVFGSEAVGVSDAMLAAADKRVYLPLHGFADSLNLSGTSLSLSRSLP